MYNLETTYLHLEGDLGGDIVSFGERKVIWF